MKSISVKNEVLMCSIIAQWGHEFLCKGCVFIYHSGKRQIRAWANINNQLACLIHPLINRLIDWLKYRMNMDIQSKLKLFFVILISVACTTWDKDASLDVNQPMSAKERAITKACRRLQLSGFIRLELKQMFKKQIYIKLLVSSKTNLCKFH